MKYKTKMARTEPATTGGTSKAVWVSTYDDSTVLITDVAQSSDATGSPFPVLEKLPTVSEVVQDVMGER